MKCAFIGRLGAVVDISGTFAITIRKENNLKRHQLLPCLAILVVACRRSV